MDIEHEENKQTSKYNDAGYSISRLHDNWLRCYSYIRRGKFNSWKIELDIIWLELFPDVLRHEKCDKYKEDNNKHIKIIADCANNKQKMFYALIKRQEFLRGLQDDSGKGGVYIDENEELAE